MAFLVGFTAPALAEFHSGNNIYRDSVSSESFAKVYCIAYIVGSFDQLKDSEEYKCVPKKNVSEGQIRDVVIAYLRNKPEARHFGAASLIHNAIYLAFCKK